MGKDDFKYFTQEFDRDVSDLVKQKGFYPFEDLSGFEKFKEQLPSKEKFHSSLAGKKISDKDYENALKVWNAFEMKTMKCFDDFYLKCDVLLLTDVFEKQKLKIGSLKNYGLCLTHYLSALALSSDAILSMTKIELQLISDFSMFLFFQNGMRVGISYISKRFSKVSDKYLITYDQEQESKHIIYLGANNLPSYALFNFLLTSGFKWIDLKEFDLNKHNGNILKGCVLELDLRYPKALWELHND